jgi:predicted deacetylase
MSTRESAAVRGPHAEARVSEIEHRASAVAERYYIPEIHDVHPGMVDRLDDLVGVLPEEARRVAAVLIVPNWQGRHPVAEDGTFCARITRLAGEPVLHGWTHSLGPDLWNWIVCGHDDRSEFARLTEGEATQRLALALDAFKRAVGRRPRWFCAPRWAQGQGAERALRAAGLYGFMLHDRFETAAGAVARLPALCFDVGERRAQIALQRVVRTAAIARLLRRARPFRLTLHPSDVDLAGTWRQVRDLVSRLEGEGWSPLSVDDAVARWSHSCPRASA